MITWEQRLLNLRSRLGREPLLPELLAEAMHHTMTPEELRVQRENYVLAELAWPEPKFKMIDGVKVYDSYEDYCNG